MWVGLVSGHRTPRRGRTPTNHPGYSTLVLLDDYLRMYLRAGLSPGLCTDTEHTRYRKSTKGKSSHRSSLQPRNEALKVPPRPFPVCQRDVALLLSDPSGRKCNFPAPDRVTITKPGSCMGVA